MSAYVCVSAQMPCYCLPAGFRVTEKTSLGFGCGVNRPGKATTLLRALLVLTLRGAKTLRRV
jgi:hypothetical protein